MSLNFASQSRINFNSERLKDAGITDIFVTPFQVNAESFQDVKTFKKNIHFLKAKADKIRRNWKESRVIINMFTICHPEGNFSVPEIFHPQLDLTGNIRPGFVCFLDERRQSELLEMYRLIAEEGFEYVLIDDDFRDAFCFCEKHLKQFTPFNGKDREELITIFNNHNPSQEEIQLRRQWLDFKKEGLFAFAIKIENALHKINNKLRIGICISAKRCNDLSGRGIREWLSLFDTPEAPIFVRLAGEHYDDYSLGISQSIGWHQYYRDLLPPDIEMMAEVTYVHPVYFKSPASISLETKIHLACGLKKVLLAWTDDYKYNNGWKMLSDEKNNFKKIKEISNEINGSIGIAIYAPENCSEFTPLDEVNNTDPVKAYQALAMMGFPVKLRDRIDITSRVTILTGYLPDGAGVEIKKYLKNGGILIVDGLAAQSFQRVMSKELVRYNISGQISGLRMEKVLQTGEVIDELAGFPYNSIYQIETKEDTNYKAEVISEMYSVEGGRKGAGTLAYPAEKGWIVVFAYDLCKINYRLASDDYRKHLTYILNKIGYKPDIQLWGSLFVQPLLFEYPNKRLILVNYNSYESEVRCEGDWIKGSTLRDVFTGKEFNAENISIPPLGIRVLEPNLLESKTG